jgi:Spy/CpxP family protein refolding chaperone
MKRAIVVAVMISMCGALYAQMPPMPPGPPGAPGRPGMPPMPPNPPDGDRIGRELFPPEMIMGHSDELGLSDKQRAAFRAEVVKLQTKVVDMQWQLSEEAERLTSIIKATPIDEAKALEQSDKVMSLEHDIKRLHLGTLIRIKNLLTPDQIAKLQSMRRQPPSE